jgi:hypothetical protein
MTACVPPGMLDRYAGGRELPAETVWVLEAHLERCAACRARLTGEPSVAGLVEAVRLAVQPRLGPGHGPWWVRRHRLRRALTRWAAPAVLPWLAMAALVPLAAMLLDLVADGQPTPVLLLVAPIVPVLAVAASWNRWTDPAYELMSVAAQAGLALVLRRTLVVLVTTLPPVAVAGVVVGTSPARWLLPGLAFTTGVLALGALIGVVRAAVALITLWSLAVVVPTVARAWRPVVLDPGSAPAWVAAILLAALVLIRFRHGYRRGSSFS